MKIVRQNRIRETLEFSCAGDTSPALVVEVDLNTDELGAAAMRAWDFLSVASAEMQKRGNEESVRELYGKAVVALFGVIFGEENAGKILAFYEGREGEMLIDLAPFFEDVMEKVRVGREARKAQLLALAGKKNAGAV